MLSNLMSLCWKFKVRSFYNGINRARLLTESTVDALCHVNVIPEKLDESEAEIEREKRGEGKKGESSFT